MTTDTCICCGAPVPEGRQVCWQCLQCASIGNDVGSYEIVIQLRPGQKVTIVGVENHTTCSTCEKCDKSIALTTDPPMYRCTVTGKYHSADYICKEDT